MAPFILAPCLLLLAQNDTADPHLKLNPLYQSLVRGGLLITGDHKLPLPAGSIPEGETAVQHKAIAALLGEDYSLDPFVRKAFTAPRLCRVHEVAAPAVKVPVYRIQLAFVVHSELKHMDDIQLYLKLAAGVPDRRHHILTAEELAKRKRTVRKTPEVEELYLHETGSYLNRVQVSLTSRAVLTRTANSLVFAKAIAPEFTHDPQMPNYWQKLQLVEDRFQPVGEKYPYVALGGYARVVKLAQPEGALFVEFQLLYAEPKDWFDGANLLRSKLPLLTHIGVLALRAELAIFHPSVGKKSLR